METPKRGTGGANKVALARALLLQTLKESVDRPEVSPGECPPPGGPGRTAQAAFNLRCRPGTKAITRSTHVPYRAFRTWGAA